MTQYPFFVYGTLRPGLGNYSWALDGYTTREETARVHGLTMFLGIGFPYATIARPERNAEATSIVGEVVWVDEQHYDDVLISLDRLEGFRGEGHPSNHYDRILVKAEVNGEEVEAYTYVASASHASYLWHGHTPWTEGDWKVAIGAVEGLMGYGLA